MSSDLRPFTISVDEADLDDLRRRLESARWPAEIPGTGWDYGTDQAFLRTVVERWVSGYDWRATEAELNDLDSARTVAAGQQVHLLAASVGVVRRRPDVLRRHAARARGALVLL